MDASTDCNWYLLRTKAYKEAAAARAVGCLGVETFLPLFSEKTVRFRQVMSVVRPLFPGYLFTYLDLRASYFEVVHASGVHSLVRIGSEPAVVPIELINEMKERVKSGPIELAPKPLTEGSKVTILHGPLEGLEAVFQYYISGARRVVLLLEQVRLHGIRVVLPANYVESATL